MTFLRSCILRRVLTYTVGLAPKWQRPEAEGASMAYHQCLTGAVRPLAGIPSFLHPAARSYLYCGLGSKVAKTRSKGRFNGLSPVPYRGSTPAGGHSFVPASCGAFLLILWVWIQQWQRPEARGDPLAYYHSPSRAYPPWGVRCTLPREVYPPGKALVRNAGYAKPPPLGER
ncbi:hypothetical protein Holit_02399 [Hollandina sp. SP2]